MGALDDLIARDAENRRQAEGGQLDALIAQAGRAQQEEQANASAPSFIGYQPPPPQPSDEPAKPDVWAQLRAARERMGGGTEPLERAAEAGVGSILPGGGPTMAGRVAAGAAGGVGMSALAKAREAMQGGDIDPEQAAREVGMSGLFGAAGGAASGVVAKAARGVSDLAQRGYKSAKNLVAGQAVRDAQAQAAMHGVDAIDENFGGMLERYSPSTGTGMSSKGHHAVVKAEKDRVGAALKALQQRVPAAEVPAARGKLLQELDTEAAAQAGQLPFDKRQYGSAVGQLAQDIRAGGPAMGPGQTFPELIRQKSGLQGFAHSGPGGSIPENASKQAAGFAGNVLKKEAQRIVEGQSPEFASRYAAENQNFAELATLEEALRNKAVRDGTGGDFGTTLASSALAGIAGAGVGALVSDDPVQGALLGGGSAFAGGLGLTGGATRTAARQAMGSRGADWGGNMLRSLASGSGRVAQAVQNLNAGGAAALGARRFGGNGTPDAQPAQPGAHVAVGQTRVEQLVRTNPQALGPYAPQLQAAARDPERLRALIANLSEREPMFRRMVRQLDQQQPAADSGLTFSLEQQ